MNVGYPVDNIVKVAGTDFMLLYIGAQKLSDSGISCRDRGYFVQWCLAECFESELQQSAFKKRKIYCVYIVIIPEFGHVLSVPT